MSLPALWKHQEKGIALGKTFPGIGLFFEQGTGKTRTAIEIIRNIFTREKRFLPSLILGPIIVLENWKVEFAKYSKIPQDKIFVCYGTGKQKLEILKKCAAVNGILITNYESILSEDFRIALHTWNPEVLVLDESQRCKNHSAKRTKYVIKIADRTGFRQVLSGTPILNSPMDIWAQFRIIDHGATFGKNFFEFRAKYFYDKNSGMPRDKYFPDWVIRSGALDEINQKIARLAVRAIKSECLDLPPLVRQEYFVELSPKQRKAYEEMKKDFITYLKDAKNNDTAAFADLAITKALRLQQIVSGYITDDKGNVIEFENTPREAALAELLEDIVVEGKYKVIIWCVFKQNYELVRRVCKRLKIKFCEAHGEVSNKAKFQAVDDFNNDPSFGVFIGHPQSLGVGINLIAAAYSTYFSRNFSLENDLQSEARNYRGGSEIHERITRIDLIAKDTIDEQVLAALKNKTNVSEAILNHFGG